MSEQEQGTSGGAVSVVWRDGVYQFTRIWGRAVIVCLAMALILLALGLVLELFGIPIFDAQPDAGWSFDAFVFNWLGWVVNYVAYAILLAKLLGDLARSGALGSWSFLRAGLPVFVLMSIPSAVVSTWMPDGELSLKYILLMVPQSILDVTLSVCAIHWTVVRIARRSGEIPHPNAREIPFAVGAILVAGLTAFLVATELLYTALGTTEWQVMTGSDDLSAIMGRVAFGAAIVALYLNVVATPSVMAAWYRNMPSMHANEVKIKDIFG